MHKLTLAAATVVTFTWIGAAQAQSYGASDPGRANTTDPNSAPTARTIYHPEAMRTHRRMGNRYGHAWNQRGFGAYASAGAYRMEGHQWNNRYQYQSGGTGSPISAGSLRGSTDRSDPSGPFASGPYGEGEFSPWR